MTEEDSRESDTLLGASNAENNRDEDLEDIEPTGCGASVACDPQRNVHRYIVLIFLCFLNFGSYFCYDNPAALSDEMKEDMHISTSQYMMFYSLYSWPNVILCFFGGFLLDSVFGLCWGTIIFSSVVTAGQLVFALGALVDSYYLMTFGRFVFGLDGSLMIVCLMMQRVRRTNRGGENLGVAQNSYAVSWFHGRALNMVFGLQISFARAGSTVNMNVMQPLYDSLSKSVTGHVCLGLTLFIGAVFCLWSLGCAFIMGFFDKRANRILNKTPPQAAEGSVTIRGLLKQLVSVKDFSIHLWIICVVCVAYYVAVLPFISLGKIFFIGKFELHPGEAALLNSLVYIISAFASPVCGFCIDRTGRNVFWVGAGILMTIGCHGLLAFTYANPLAPVIILGIAYSILASALWPMVALVVERHQIGTAYGIIQSIQNLGLALIAIAAGAIVDRFGYFILEVFFLVCLFVALIAVVFLYFVDAAQEGKLNSSAHRRKLLAEMEEIWNMT